MHVPPPAVSGGASYGLYAHTHAVEREQCRELLGGQPLDDEQLDGEIAGRRFSPPEEYCTVCGCEHVVVAVIPRAKRGPPEQQVDGRTA